MQIIHDAVVGLFVLLSGALISRFMAVLQEEQGLVNDVLGPVGALALALIVIGFLLRYLDQERKQAREIQQRLDAQKDKENEQLRAELRELRARH